MSEETTVSAKSAPKRRKGAAGLGLVVILLSIVGFVTLIAGGTKLFYLLTDDSALREEYSDLVNPIVMLDPPNFSEPSKLSDSLVLQTTIWTVAQQNTLSKYAEDEEGRILIPVADLEVACTELYGGNAAIVRRSMNADGTEYDPEDDSYSTVVFEYIAASDCVALPVMGEFGEYRAKVEKIDRVEGDLYLTVGYYPNSDSWTDEFLEEKSTDVAAKYKLIILKKSAAGSYYVYSLQNSDVDGIL